MMLGSVKRVQLVRRDRSPQNDLPLIIALLCYQTKRRRGFTLIYRESGRHRCRKRCRR